MSKENQLPDYLENGEQARLIPVGKGTQRENRATSVLLSGMSSILPLSKRLFKDSPGEYPVIQGLSIEAMLDGHKPNLPPILKRAA